MTALAYGFVRAAADGWSDTLTLTSFVAGGALLALFVANERRATQPITPLRLFASRERSGAYLARALVVTGMFGMFFFVTQFLQGVLHFSPLQAGIAFLPTTARHVRDGAGRATDRLPRSASSDCSPRASRPRSSGWSG